MIRNCANCDHCYAKMNGKIFCELDDAVIKNPYAEVDCEEHTLTGRSDDDLKVKLNEIADDLVNLYVKVKSLIKEDATINEPPTPKKEVDEEDYIELPKSIQIDDATMENILRKLLG